MDFDEDGEPLVCFAGGVVQFHGQRSVFLRIDPVKKARSAARFVALQVADQMPTWLQVGEPGLLPFPLLNAIFAEGANAGVVSGANCFRKNVFEAATKTTSSGRRSERAAARAMRS